MHSLVNNIRHRNYSFVVNSRWVTLVPCGVRWTRIQIAIQMDNLGTRGSLGVCTAGKHFQPQVIKMTDSHSAYMELYPVIFSQENLPLKSVGGFRLKNGSQSMPLYVKTMELMLRRAIQNTFRWHVWGNDVYFYNFPYKCIITLLGIMVATNLSTRMDWTGLSIIFQGKLLFFLKSLLRASLCHWILASW